MIAGLSHNVILMAALTALCVVAGCSSSDSGGSGGCTPGDQKACACAGGTQGAQVCKADGTGWDECTGCNASPACDAGAALCSYCESLCAKSVPQQCNPSAWQSTCPGYCLETVPKDCPSMDRFRVYKDNTLCVDEPLDCAALGLK